MRMFKWLTLSFSVGVALASVQSGAQSNSGNDEPKVVALVLADVTSSLDKSQSRQVADLAASTINELPAGASVGLYPIHMATENPRPILKQQIISGDREIQSAIERPRSILIHKRVAALYKNVNDHPEIDARTCILNELIFAGNYFRQNASPHDHKVLVILSDMIEDCITTPIGQGIHLNKIEPRKAIQAAQRIPSIPGLTGVRIIAVLPSSSLSTHPRLEDLEKFWREVVSRVSSDPANRTILDWCPGSLPARFSQRLSAQDSVAAP